MECVFGWEYRNRVDTHYSQVIVYAYTEIRHGLFGIYVNMDLSSMDIHMYIYSVHQKVWMLEN